LKILIDQNISFRAIPLLAKDPNLGQPEDSVEWFHVKQFGLESASDLEIWNFAKVRSFNAIMSADRDLYNLLLQNGIPPKLIWLRIGNGSFQRIASVVRTNQETIGNFLTNLQMECLEIWP